MGIFSIQTESGQPVWSAHIVRSDGMGVVSDMDGIAVVADSELPGIWTISHVSHPTKTVTISTGGNHTIVLAGSIDLPEVEIFPEDTPPPTSPPASPPPPAPPAPATTNNYWWILAGLATIVFLSNRR